MYITTIGMYNYLKMNNQDLFEYMSLPEGIDRQLLIDNILLSSEPFEVIYPNSDLFAHAIGIWSAKYQKTFEKFLEGINAEYNPIENYDRYEDITDSHNHNSRIENNSNVDDTMMSSGQQESNNLNKISAFDSNNLVNDNSQTIDVSNSNQSHNISQASTDSNESADDTNIHEAHIHGNIGVTTAPAMLKEHYEISKFNIIDAITELFLSEFCIRTY